MHSAVRVATSNSRATLCIDFAELQRYFLFMSHRLNAFFASQLTCIALILGACTNQSHNSAPKEMPGTLYTQQLPGDIKLFKFVLLVPDQPVRPITQRDPNRASDSASEIRNHTQQQLKRMEKGLGELQALQDFCPNGFIIVERYAVLRERVIRGECQYGDQLSKE
jgi:hypothetical protein